MGKPAASYRIPNNVCSSRFADLCTMAVFPAEDQMRIKYGCTDSCETRDWLRGRGLPFCSANPDFSHPAFHSLPDSSADRIYRTRCNRVDLGKHRYIFCSMV